jgi:hypothetical protein
MVPDSYVLDRALAALSPEKLREVVRDLLLELDDRAHARVTQALVERAARGSSAWSPGGPSGEVVSSIVAFAAAAAHVGRADPSEVDDYLREGSMAILASDYPAALEIFRALLVPLNDGEIHLGEHETVDEVLGADVAACAARYVVATYMTATPARRAEAVCSAIAEVSALAHFSEPLREMERVAVEPLSQLDDFLPRWRGLVEERCADQGSGAWEEAQWRREVVRRMEGPDGLARIAHSTRCVEDFRAWCRMLVQARDWRAALSAHEDAAESGIDELHSRGEFLDGAALAAQELGRRDLPSRLERAWRRAPSMLRLLRWLGSADSKASVRKRAAQALEACPKRARRQRGLLHLLMGDVPSAAKLLATAPGLGWSDDDHPGHLLFPLFRAALGGKPSDFPDESESLLVHGLGVDEADWMGAEPDEPRLATPEVREVLKLAGVGGPSSADARAAMLRALRKAAEKRAAGVTGEKRRRHYAHAAQLVADCAAADPTPDTAGWVASIRDEYRRYPALQRELRRHLGRA